MNAKSLFTICSFRAVHFCVAVTIAILLFSISGSAVAWNPQPEPTANVWRVEGFVDMTALEILPTGEAMPFGVERTIISDTQVDFRAGVIATFTAPDETGDGKPDDGFYTPKMEYFRVQIGDTSWDETMPSQDLEFQIQRGVVMNVHATVTVTLTGHPDLEFMFSASPGAWVATDERDGKNVGTISGSYALRDGEVINKPQISVADGFIKLDVTSGSAPLTSNCNDSDHSGRMVYDEINNIMYICSQSGWKEK